MVEPDNLYLSPMKVQNLDSLEVVTLGLSASLNILSAPNDSK